ncbi:hypothetical protein DDB_G0282037 [Dictyostelium discoideum AX4]|uniref:Uncharacterized protein n=1 Tax=Dictyostelium discoideum TaxID=44689 RepID=Q54T22_DICDI|nr:hypothetical protein DDB_G0282037 [Dictyostelium discoideum AX4]EAL66440.1 hypothetical protein DDB_G0282037 [Dictyostelium discoideum AX4]|eukprot:XP_640429.1 hypothetical protein DDB_G0282037 [Dictyostelium discoideum AX4]
MSLFKSISSISKVNTTSANSTVTSSQLNNQSFGENKISADLVTGLVSGLLFGLANVTQGLGL